MKYVSNIVAFLYVALKVLLPNLGILRMSDGVAGFDTFFFIFGYLIIYMIGAGLFSATANVETWACAA